MLYEWEVEMFIPVEECKPGFLYKIASRNLAIGVFNPLDNGFIGIRTKFGHRYLFTEYHWDTGAPFGTVKPVEALEACPESMTLTEENEKLFDWIEERLTRLNKDQEAD
jgi:hypothetical protein